MMVVFKIDLYTKGRWYEQIYIHHM